MNKLDKLIFATVALLATVGCATCYYRHDSQGYFKACGDPPVVKCTSQKRLPNEECQ